jgi:hypothetical protein
MNKAITDGILLMPPAFANGLDVWSSGDGTPGSDTYNGAANAAFVPADQDFGGCLELFKTEATQRLRFMGETPILPGCYLRVSARVKAVSGNLPSLRVAGWAGGAGGAHVTGLTDTGPATALSTYGEVIEISAIVGTGLRGGVDMPWGMTPLYGHFGLDLTGPTGGVVRIDDIRIEDVTSVYLRDMLGQVDVRDYGARGDGVTDDTATFIAADDAADGRHVFIPAGSFFLADSVTLENPAMFEGTLTMPTDKIFVMRKSFDLPSYIAAFGDEETAFRKAFQALLNNADHDSLDLGGRKVTLTGPVDMQAAVPNKTSFATRRVIRNGQLDASGGAAWDTATVTSLASYTAGDPKKLTDVVNVANIPVGALVEGTGVGREIYVRARNIGAGELTLSGPLYGAPASQTYTFRDFRYMLDFSGFSSLSKFELCDVELQCNGNCSALRLPTSGSIFSLRGCVISRPMDRGITSIGTGCQGMLVDNCQFLSDEESLDVEDRVSIGLNANSNDVKLRNCRSTRFMHFAVLGGANNMISGNHCFQGDSVAGGIRHAGIVLTSSYVSTTITANYIDNCHVEWTNEHDATPDFTSGMSFAGLTVSDNIFLSGDVAPWTSHIVIKPFGTGQYLNGVMVTGNKFRSINGSIDRAERVDDSIAPLDATRHKHVAFHSNSYHQVSNQVANPARVIHSEPSASQTWTVDLSAVLPFAGRANGVDAVVAQGRIRTGSDAPQYAMPHVILEQAPAGAGVDLQWGTAVKGEIALVARMDS